MEGSKGNGEGGGFSAAEAERAKRLVELQSRLSDQLLANFAENMKALSHYQPELARIFKDYRPRESMEFFCTENGEANLTFVERNEIFYKSDSPRAFCKSQVDDFIANQNFRQVNFAHEYDPFGQIHFRYLNEITDRLNNEILPNLRHVREIGESLPCLVVLGCGLGYCLEELYGRLEILNLVLIEPNPDLFFASLHTCAWAQLFKFLEDNNYPIRIIVGERPGEAFERLYDFYVEHGQFMGGFKLNFVHYRSPEVDACEQQVVAKYDRIHSSLGFFDDQVFGTSHAVHNVLDGHHLVKRDTEFPDAMRDYPLFVVANGPSLDQDMAFLRANQDKAIIMACGTALDTLYHAGVKPDLYAATERTESVAQSVEMIPDRDFLKDIALVCMDVIHPRTAALFGHSLIFSKYDEPFCKLVRSFPGIDNWRPLPLGNPLVANCAVSAAVVLGFRKIYLLGLDCGARADASACHSRYSTIYSRWGNSENVMRNDLQRPLPGNFGGEVLSGGLYEMCARNIEIVIALYRGRFERDFRVFNCSDGLAIRGTEPLRSMDSGIPGLPDLDKRAFLSFIDHELTFVADCRREDLMAMLDFSSFDRLVDLLAGVWKHDLPRSRAHFVQRMEACVEQLSDLAKSNLGFYADIISGSVNSFFLQMLRGLYCTSDALEGLGIGKSLLGSYINFLSDSKAIIRQIPDYLIGQQQRIFNNKVGFDHEGSPAPSMPSHENLRLSDWQDGQRTFEKRYS
ncbi:MAG: DUF115 domain-containing protein [Succinivibrionaceae bacterium]|nr:DUF115 domain-containing protein [Succinivibrionaceae bacterium]